MGFNHPWEVEGNGFPDTDLGATCTEMEMARQSPATGYHGKPVHSAAHRRLIDCSNVYNTKQISPDKTKESSPSVGDDSFSVA